MPLAPRTREASRSPDRAGAAFRKRLSRLPTSPTFSRRANRDRGWIMEFVRRTIEINGCKLSLARGGKGAPLMYLHGTDGLAEWPAILDGVGGTVRRDRARSSRLRRVRGAGLDR